ncbi:chromosome alignment-maintaining phosphoprotein 1 [Sarotherodon galilaeus]
MEKQEQDGLLDGEFKYKKNIDGTINKRVVICTHCSKEFQFHRSNSTLKYHLNAKHAFVGAAASPGLRQTTLSERRPLGKSSLDKLTDNIAKWIAKDCRPLSIVEDKGFADDPAYVVRFKEKFKEDLASRQEHTNYAWLQIATALDPRFKDLRSVPKTDREAVRSHTAEEGPAKKRLSLLQMDSDSESEEEVQQDRAIQRYRAEPCTALEDCPLQWWAAHAGAHSQLARLARRYLATPASTVPCERLFSVAGHIVNKKRSALHSENVDKLVCLSNWLKDE